MSSKGCVSSTRVSWYPGGSDLEERYEAHIEEKRCVVLCFRVILGGNSVILPRA